MTTISPPKFIPFEPASSTSPLTSDTEPWTEILVSNCHFGLSTFLAVLKDLCLHPERNSNLILRADGLPLRGVQDAEIPRYAPVGGGEAEASGSDEAREAGEEGEGRGRGEGLEKMELVEEIRVRLMPRQPNRDGKMDQRCLFFRTPRPGRLHESSVHTNGSLAHSRRGVIDTADCVPAPGHESSSPSTTPNPHPTAVPTSQHRQQAYVIYIPEVASRADQPYYYPPVRKLAYRYETLSAAEAEAAHSAVVRAEREKRREARRRDKERERAKVLLAIKAKIKAGVAVDDAARAMLERYQGGGGGGGEGEGENGGEGGGDEEGEGDGEAADDGVEDIPPFMGRISIAYLPWDTPPPVADDTIPGYGHGGVLPRSKAKKRSPLAQESGSNGHSQNPASTLSDSMRNLAVKSTTTTTDGQKDSEAQKAEQEKLYRVCLNLLERVYRCGFGLMMGYQKRMNHDVVVPRDAFQDLYLKLKDRHRHLESRKPNPKSRVAKDEDVKRHVYKDVAIAAFLMLLWKDMYPARVSADNDAAAHGGSRSSLEEEVREWDSWGRPEGGFVDLGCGNGLLVHVLLSEGYIGKGYELRARRTWPTYPPATQDSLVELPIDFPSWFPNTMDEWEEGNWKGKEGCAIKEGCFIIGNHADEITPWIPLLSLLPPTPTPFLSLPCCAHTLDALFTQIVFRAPPHPHMPPDGLDAGLEKGQSKYKAFLMYLGHQGLMCGWEWEKEGLRVPSTRGWGIVGRNRWAKTPEQIKECRRWALEQVQGVRTRGAFQVREKEGKDH